MSNGTERFVVVSSDSHAGASLLGYRAYLDPEWREDFDPWAASYVDPWADVDAGESGIKAGLAAGTLESNWDSDLRQRQVEPDGVVGEVLFPNTAPPFFPVGSLLAGPPTNALTTNAAWPACAPTTAGWPSSAPSSLADEPA
jgi:hypothetical protein